MPLQATSGAASYDAFGGGVPAVPNYIEEVFSTTLYTGNGSTQTITNGIDLSTKGGLVWFKRRSTAISHALFDSARSSTSNALFTNTTGAQVSSYGVTFNSNGVSLGQSEPEHNSNGETYASWTFRKQPKFFDVVTYTGNGTDRTIAHNLGSVPGCIIIKAYSGSGAESEGWRVYHRSQGATKYAMLQSTNAFATASSVWNDTEPTSTNFTVGTDTGTNGSGLTFIAYLFAHNAGGFGLTGTDNVISCGSFSSTDDGSLINLGYEPQFVLWKKTNSAGGWFIADTMRGLTSKPPSSGQANTLYANTTGAEAGLQYYIGLGSQGFYEDGLGAGNTYIYIAIRRGPMKVPTSGTSVFSPQIATSSGSASNTVTTNFPVDLAITQVRNGYFAELLDRLRGDSQSTYVRLRSASTAAEATGAFGLGFDNNTGYVDNYNWQNFGGGPFVYWNFRRAPSFFDEVCYTGTGSTQTIAHNLGVAPELYIVKQRSSAQGWCVGSSYIANTGKLALQTDSEVFTDSTAWNSTYPTSSVLTVGSLANTNENAKNFVAYLFATCAGVSKVGSYTGNGSNQTINCGFTGGARFVMIKATSTTGDWMVADSARGIVSGNDPYLELNNTNAEVTGEDWLDTDSTGFVVNQVSASNANTNGVTYIFLAIA